MHKGLSTLLFLLAGLQLLHAQTGADPKSSGILTLHSNDSVIMTNVIQPMLASQQQPDWTSLAADVRAKYGESYVDRSVTKAKIYYYYGKDWPAFSKALVHYTDAYENRNDLKLMNTNAKMVLEHSQDPEEWKSAVAWVKHAVDKEPENGEYKETYDALSMKVRQQAMTGGH